MASKESQAQKNDQTNDKTDAGSLQNSLAKQIDSKDGIGSENLDDNVSTVSKRICLLRNRKKTGKGRLTRTRKQLFDLLKVKSNGNIATKTEIKRAVQKVKDEYELIENIIRNMKKIMVLDEDQDENVDATIEILDKEIDELTTQVDEAVQAAQYCIQRRLDMGEIESTTSKSIELSDDSDDDNSITSNSKLPSEMEKKRLILEAQEANDRLLKIQREQEVQELELQNREVELLLARQRTEEAQKIAELSQARAKATNEYIRARPSTLWQQYGPSQPPAQKPFSSQKITSVRLKGVELPKFSGEDKLEYEPWKAAFMSVVDQADLSASEKMLRLQNCLYGKALTMVKDLGYSMNAYERAKEKLEKKYGGERRLMIKHLLALRGLQNVRSRNLEDMENFLVILERVLIALQDSGPGRDLTNQNLSLTAKEKLPQEDVQAYKYWLIEHSHEDTFETLIKWIEIRVQIMEESREETTGFAGKREEKRYKVHNTSFKPRKCIVVSCGEDHPPWTCKEFKALSASERKELITKAKRCYRCLAAGHLSTKCPNARRCGINGCNSNTHSRYLHNHDSQQSEDKTKQHNNGDTFAQVKPQEPRAGMTIDPTKTKEKTYITCQAENVSLMVLPASIVKDNKRLKVNVMLDNCSTGSYISEAAAEELQLQGETQHLTISGTGGLEVKKNSRHVELTVTSSDNSFSAKLHANVLDNISSDTPAFEWSILKSRWPHLESVPFQNVAKRRQIDLLIGSDHPLFHRVLKEVHGKKENDPIARQTNLGWVCFGPTLTEEFRRTSKSHFTRNYRSSQVKETGEDSNDILRKFWELEAIGIHNDTDRELTPDEKAAVAQATKTLRYENERYEIGIPWKEGEPNLVNNHEMAYSRLKTQESSLRRKGPEITNAYDQIIKDYERKGYVTKVEKSEASNQWFLPHFPVVKEDRTTTKVRMVFDAAAKHNGKSLNDAVRSGPKLQRDLNDVLTRFRRAPIALSADISEMFLQVSLREGDRRYHRFLWRSFDSTRDPDQYEFQRLLFGNRASPFCSQYVLHTHAEAHARDYPQATDTINNAMYVDDVLDSCETVNEALRLRRDLSELLTKGGFKLRKWLSNDSAVLEDVPEDDRLQNLEIQEEEPTNVRTLGVLWDATSDVFTFRAKPPDVNMKLTKRNVLSAIATLFDPLQFLSPFTIRARILMQEIWIAGVGWDDVLPRELITKWEKWISELPQLSSISIPRCLRRPNPSQTQLHLFSDASREAYASVAYLVCKYSDNTTSSCIVASKSRVAPTKAVTIPRLELMGAVLSTRLAANIGKTVTVDRTVFWTDSTNVLHWVRNQSREFKPFVANRIGELHRSTNPEQWRHVPGEVNPADLPTRGLSATDLADNKLWMEGPIMLQADESTWPPVLPNEDKATNVVEDSERRKKAQCHVAKECKDGAFIDPSHFSSFKRLIHVTGWVQRFLANCRSPKEQREKSRVLKPVEAEKAETFWLEQVQTEAFPNGVTEKSLISLHPKRDDKGLLRADGRLRYAEELPYDVRHPILLPKDHDVTRLIITNTHEELGHGSGVEHALTELRSRYWIIKGRQAVRNVIFKCPGCRRRFTGKPAGQMMAPLPKSRLQCPLRAFERVGVDYGGPYLTKQGRGKTRAKRYLCLFTCLSTRAVHLEMAYSMDTDSFINAFTRMVSRRGTPKYIISDNGTNFVGAERELRELVEALDQDKIAQKTAHTIEWKFNPPCAPHFGGVFEAMIKSAKKAMRSILGNADIYDEELHTAICGAENLLNSRPITVISSDSNDLSPLTPCHFLTGQIGGKFAPEVNREEIFDPRKRWHRVQQLLSQFWKRWRREFLPSLNTRKKWFHPKHNLKEGDVVMLIEPDTRRGEWPLGRVIEGIPGPDGLVRVVKVKTGNKEYLRPVHRLCPLEYTGESQENS